MGGHDQRRRTTVVEDARDLFGAHASAAVPMFRD